MITFSAFAELARGNAQAARRRFQSVQERPHHRTALHWYWRLFAQLGSAEASLALGDLAAAARHADTLIHDVSIAEDAYMRGLAFELRARIALAGRQRTRAEAYIADALQTIEHIQVPLAAWQVHATASDVYRVSQRKKAARHLAKAKAIVSGLARSLDIESMRRSFLRSPRVRRIVEPATADRARRRSRPRRAAAAAAH